MRVSHRSVINSSADGPTVTTLPAALEIVFDRKDTASHAKA